MYTYTQCCQVGTAIKTYFWSCMVTGTNPDQDTECVSAQAHTFSDHCCPTHCSQFQQVCSTHTMSPQYTIIFPTYFSCSRLYHQRTIILQRQRVRCRDGHDQVFVFPQTRRTATEKNNIFCQVTLQKFLTFSQMLNCFNHTTQTGEEAQSHATTRCNVSYTILLLGLAVVTVTPPLDTF